MPSRYQAIFSISREDNVRADHRADHGSLEKATRDANIEEDAHVCRESRTGRRRRRRRRRGFICE